MNLSQFRLCEKYIVEILGAPSVNQEVILQYQFLGSSLVCDDLFRLYISRPFITIFLVHMSVGVDLVINKKLMSTMIPSFGNGIWIVTVPVTFSGPLVPKHFGFVSLLLGADRMFYSMLCTIS